MWVSRATSSRRCLTSEPSAAYQRTLLVCSSPCPSQWKLGPSKRGGVGRALRGKSYSLLVAHELLQAPE